MNQKGVIALTVPLLLLVILAAIAFILVSQGYIKLPVKSLPKVPGTTSEPTVSLQTKYDNPFDGKFVNPFAGYKNPFDALK